MYPAVHLVQEPMPDLLEKKPAAQGEHFGARGREASSGAGPAGGAACGAKLPGKAVGAGGGAGPVGVLSSGASLALVVALRVSKLSYRALLAGEAAIDILVGANSTVRAGTRAISRRCQRGSRSSWTRRWCRRWTTSGALGAGGGA